MKTSIFSKSNLGLFFVGLFISGFILLKSTDSIGDPTTKKCPIPSKEVCAMSWARYPFGNVIIIRGMSPYVTPTPTTSSKAL
jgi:hypothetical protein